MGKRDKQAWETSGGKFLDIVCNAGVHWLIA